MTQPESQHYTSASGEPLKCIWMLAGVLTYRLCDREYDCERCPLDAALRETAPFGGARADLGSRPTVVLGPVMADGGEQRR